MLRSRKSVLWYLCSPDFIEKRQEKRLGPDMPSWGRSRQVVNSLKNQSRWRLTANFSRRIAIYALDDGKTDYPSRANVFHSTFSLLLRYEDDIQESEVKSMIFLSNNTPLRQLEREMCFLLFMDTLVYKNAMNSGKYDVHRNAEIGWDWCIKG